MKLRSFIICVLALCAISADAGQHESETGKIILEVEGLRSDAGTVRVSLYNSKKGFPTNAEKALKVLVVGIAEKRAVATFEDIPYGEYAAAALHDENGNGKMDFKWLMLPAEGFGASNVPEKRITPPGFKDASFVLDSQRMSLKIPMHY